MSATSTAQHRTRWVITRDAAAPGTGNMQRDSELLEACARGEIAGAVRLYAFSPPCLSLGRLQPWSDVDLDACRRDGIDIVRRPSGGRAVLHDDEVTYAVVCTVRDAVFGGTVVESCSRIHAVVAAGLARLGVTAAPHAWEGSVRERARAAATVADCFAAPAAHELVDARGTKLVGSAQHRLRGALLQHGSVPLEPSRAHRYVRREPPPGRASIRAAAGRHVSADELADALEAAFREALDTT